MSVRERKKGIIYTDGSCTRGRGSRENPRAGIGVYWEEGEPSSMNISERITGRQTSQRAEILAAVRGIKLARDLGYDEITVRLDSLYVKRAAERNIARWERDNWTRDLVNKVDFQALRDAMRGIECRFEKVPSLFNKADPLARAGTRKTLLESAIESRRSRSRLTQSQ